MKFLSSCINFVLILLILTLCHVQSQGADEEQLKFEKLAPGDNLTEELEKADLVEPEIPSQFKNTAKSLEIHVLKELEEFDEELEEFDEEFEEFDEELEEFDEELEEPKNSEDLAEPENVEKSDALEKTAKSDDEDENNNNQEEEDEDASLEGHLESVKFMGQVYAKWTLKRIIQKLQKDKEIVEKANTDVEIQAEKTLKESHKDLQETFDEIKEQITKLEAHSQEKGLFTCFIFNFIPNLFKKAVNITTSCIGGEFKKALNAGITLLTEIRNLTEVASTIPEKIEKCGMLAFFCIYQVVNEDIAFIAESAEIISSTIADTSLHFSNPMAPFFSCITEHVDYKATAWKYLEDTKECISKKQNQVLLVNKFHGDRDILWALG